MKYTKFLMIPVIAVFASCGAGVDTAAQDADIAAKVEAKIATTKSQLQADCDARVVLAGKMRADSINAAKTARKAPPVVAPVSVAVPAKAAPVAAAKPAPAPVVVKKPVTVKKPVVPVVKKPETVGNGKPKMGSTTTVNGKPSVGNGKPKMGAPAQTVKVKTDQGEVKEVEAVGNGKPKMGK